MKLITLAVAVLTPILGQAICPQDIQDIENYCVLQCKFLEVELRNSKPSPYSKWCAYAEGKLDAYKEVRVLCEMKKNRHNLNRL